MVNCVSMFCFLLIFDCDGVINFDFDDYIKIFDEWIFIFSLIEVIVCLSKVGWIVVVVINQFGIVCGYYDLVVFEVMYVCLCELVVEQGGEVGFIVYCLYGLDDGCECCKLKLGMLWQIGEYYGVDLLGIWFVGDSIGDLEVVWVVDCQLVLVKIGKGVCMLGKFLLEGILIFDDLVVVVSVLFQ